MGISYFEKNISPEVSGIKVGIGGPTFWFNHKRKEKTYLVLITVKRRESHVVTIRY